MSSTPTTQSRIRGAFLGLAVCDALGGPVEFKPRGTFDSVTGMLPNHNFKLGPGHFTDDTSMALCLAHSLLETHPNSSAVHQVSRYLAWYRIGYMSSVGRCFDIGTTTRGALGAWKHAVLVDAKHGPASESPDAAKTQQATRQAHAAIEKRLNHRRACGNGSLMRVLPVGLLFAHDIPAAVQVAAASSRVTHPHPRCVLACALYTILVARCVWDSAVSKESLVCVVVAFVAALDDAVVDAKAKVERLPFVERFRPYTSLAAWLEKDEKDISSSGYVVDSLEAALWAFFTTASFREGAVRAVNLGGDADTVGAIYGGLAGTFYGDEQIPGEWLADMRRLDLVEEVVEKVVEVRVRVLEGVKGGDGDEEGEGQDMEESIAASVELLGL